MAGINRLSRLALSMSLCEFHIRALSATRTPNATAFSDSRVSLPFLFSSFSAFPSTITPDLATPSDPKRAKVRILRDTIVSVDLPPGKPENLIFHGEPTEIQQFDPINFLLRA